MYAHVAQFNAVLIPELLEDGSNLSDFFIADVVGHCRFAQNFGGYPRSEIAEINSQASLQTAMSLFNDLQQSEGSYLPADMSSDEIMLSHKSKYIQAPSEMIDFIEKQLYLRDSKRSASTPPKENTIEFDANDVVDKV